MLTIGKDISDTFDEKNLPFSAKCFLLIFALEFHISQEAAKLWCRLKGERFEKREPSRNNSCILVTKTDLGISAFSLSAIRPIFRFFGLLSKPKSENTPGFWALDLKRLELESYELNCTEDASFGQGQKVFASSLGKKENCIFCGRCFVLRKGDRKIIGGFDKDAN